MHVDMSFTPKELRGLNLRGKIVVVIDVLRACSTIVYAFSQGCKAIYPAASVPEARRRAEKLSGNGLLLGGERKGVRIKGFELGNSPLEYTSKNVKGKILVFTTTNCTKNLAACTGARKVILCAFLNISAVADYLARKNIPIILALAGVEGRFSLEDAVCAGLLIHRLSKKRPLKLSDSAHSAYLLYQHYGRRILDAFFDSDHGRYLKEIGFGKDLKFCALVGKYKIIPRFSVGRITL